MHAAHRNDPWTRAEPVRKPRVKNRRRAGATARGNVLPGPRTDNLWRNDVRTNDRFTSANRYLYIYKARRSTLFWFRHAYIARIIRSNYLHDYTNIRKLLLGNGRDKNLRDSTFYWKIFII